MRRIGVTLGDPAGIGPDILAAAIAGLRLPPDAALVVSGTEGIYRARRVMAGGESPEFEDIGHPSLAKASGLYWVESPCEEKGITGGKPSRDAALAAVSYLERAAGWARDGAIAALVTGPVSKKRISDAGIPFVGHTEFLAARAGVRHPVMMFVGGGLRVALVTTHAAVRRVAGMITPDRIVETLRVVHDGLRRLFDVPAPRIGVLGLNPHAGDGGLFGREEEDVIVPALRAAAERGVPASGPLPPDTAFRRALAGEFDVLVAMYHDQALPVVKTLAEDAVNLTLGLPYPRTAPDHGPAYDAVGRPGLRSAPMRAAIECALRLAGKSGGLF